jgi:hypothetical protein
MFKGKFVALSLIAAALLCWQVLPVETASSGIIDPCSSTANSLGGCYFVCPAGDAGNLSDISATIFVTVKEASGLAIPGIPAADFWLMGCLDILDLCAGAAAINADSASNALGKTTISGSLAASSCELAGLSVVIQGVVVADPLNCNNPLCLAIVTTSPDIDGNGGIIDGVVDIIDLAKFAVDYTSPPKPYVQCIDFNCDGLVDIIDFALFAQHYTHNC